MQQQPETTPSIEASFGLEVAKFRIQKGFSQRLFARFLTDRGLAVDASAVSRIESGARAIRLSEAMTIAEVLGVDLDMLVEGSRSPEQRLKALRLVADHSMQGLDRAALDFLESFKDLNRFIQQHPELLGELEDPIIGTPNSPQEYLSWVAHRMKALRKDSPLFASENPAESKALKSLMLGFLSGTSTDSSEGSDVVDPEAG